MAGTKKRQPDIKTVVRWIQQGYGQGVGKTYKPGLYVRDVPSEGLSSSTHSQITDREHHYLSGNEHRMHLLAEYSQRTMDIREQYALLPWELTQHIARQFGLAHPQYRGTRTPLLMTTDLVITLKEPNGQRSVAFAVKPRDELTPRTLQKLFIERMYWRERGIEWQLVTDRELRTNRSSNLLFFEPSILKTAGHLDPQTSLAVARSFEANHTPEATFQEILARTTAKLGLDANLAHKLLGFAVWKRTSRIDIDASPLSHDAPVVLRSVESPA